MMLIEARSSWYPTDDELDLVLTAAVEAIEKLRAARKLDQHAFHATVVHEISVGEFSTSAQLSKIGVTLVQNFKRR